MASIRFGGLTAAAILAAGIAGAAPATAQQVITDPQQIAACLCLEQSIAQNGADMGHRRQMFDQRTGELMQLDQQIQRERPQVNESDPVQVARFRDLLERRDRLAQAIDGPMIADLQASIARYNLPVEEHRIRCLGRYYDDMVMNQVRLTLACPRR
ncbi:MAG: hypothetical protein AB7O45_15860 [Alphaproteobacteria bacterium]